MRVCACAFAVRLKLQLTDEMEWDWIKQVQNELKNWIISNQHFADETEWVGKWDRVAYSEWVS